jgi:hypothetical protein
MYKKEKPYKGTPYRGCVNCSNVQKTAPLDTPILDGFSDTYISKDDKVVYRAKDDFENYPTLKKFELMARKSPGSDWRYVNFTPLHGEVYQRHGKDKWVLGESNQGFA